VRWGLAWASTAIVASGRDNSQSLSTLDGFLAVNVDVMICLWVVAGCSEKTFCFHLTIPERPAAKRGRQRPLTPDME
jgi:hypothetical protein